MKFTSLATWLFSSSIIHFFRQKRFNSPTRKTFNFVVTKFTIFKSRSSHLVKKVYVCGKLSIFLEIPFLLLRSILFAVWKCRCIVVSQKFIFFCLVHLIPLHRSLFISVHFVWVHSSVLCFLVVHPCVQEIATVKQVRTEFR
jgi:hypothetical protein